MRVCFAVLYHEAAGRSPRAYLDAMPLHRHLPRALAARGHDVHVVLAYAVDACFREDGVTYHFRAASAPARRLGRVVGRTLGHAPALYEPALRALRRIRTLAPDVVHVHGTSLHLNLALLRLASRRGGPPVVLHYHGGYPSSWAAARTVQRFNFGGARRFLFTTPAHAAPFVEAGLIRDAADVVAFMEVSSPFRLRPRAECRRETGMTGDPVFLWTGRLHPIKDPMTVLHGFETILQARPEAHLYVYHRTDELLPQVRAFLAERPPLQAHVHLRGRAPFAQMEAVYNSADVFVQASHREFSGCAVLEALSCGALPVVTDLPSFRAMTAEGRFGVLFPRGDAAALAHRTLALSAGVAPDRLAIRAHFEAAFSYPALAAQLDAVYQDVHAGAPAQGA